MPSLLLKMRNLIRFTAHSVKLFVMQKSIAAFMLRKALDAIYLSVLIRLIVMLFLSRLPALMFFEQIAKRADCVNALHQNNVFRAAKLSITTRRICLFYLNIDPARWDVKIEPRDIPGFIFV